MNSTGPNKDKNLPSTNYVGTVRIGNKDIPCAVLYPESKKPIRVFIQREVVGLLTGNKKGGLERYLSPKNLIPYVPEKFKNGIENSVIRFELNGRESHGFVGSDLIDICKMYHDARKNIKLHPSQEHLADMAEIIVYSFAKTGVDAIIDEATGFQDVRVKDALEQIFNEYLLKEAKKYTVTFPLELYKQMFRLNSWEWKPENAQKRPQIIGKWTNDLIYDRMAPGLLKELERRNPKNEKGQREFKHFQLLSDEVGEPKLREFFGGLLALARANTNFKKFYSMVERAYPKPPTIGDNYKLDL